MESLYNLLPKSWNEVTVAQYIEIKELENEFEGFELLVEKLALLLDTSSDDELLDISVDEVISIFGKISWINKEPTEKFIKNIGDYSVKDLDKLNLGEFIDIEHFIQKFSNLHKVCAILYKQTKTDEWGNIIEEPYLYDIETRAKFFLDKPITACYGIYSNYAFWRNNFMEVYEGLFNDPKSNEIEDEETLDPEELQEIKKEIKDEADRVKWSWESTLWKLSGHDITRYKDLFDVSLILVFNTLGMIKSVQPEN